MYKLIVFDLDGVLIDSKDIHFIALNKALAKIAPGFEISKQDHLSKFDGCSTQNKLDQLTLQGRLPRDLHVKIQELKQIYTREFFSSIQKDEPLVETLTALKEQTEYLVLASNSVRDTVDLIATKLGIKELFDLLLSNEDVNSQKPHPEIYWRAMMFANANPSDTIIFEDSVVGLRAAVTSGANVIRVRNRQEVNLEEVNRQIKDLKLEKKVKWNDSRLNILIPMAGAGSRFMDAGYTFPKPLVEVEGQPMIQKVVENLNIDANYIFIVQEEHFLKYNLESVLNLIAPGCRIIRTEGVTEGAACTAMLAKELINTNDPLLIANSDQIIEWNSSEFMYSMQSQNLDGGLAVFHSTHPKWSFARIDDEGLVVEVAEKKPISDIATVGIYFWKRGEDFVSATEQMIEKNLRVNNEFYICPTYNQAISRGLKIGVKFVKKMWGIGTPEDLQTYLARDK
jgi:HAD superfamily hydrolase (TIGR01509 family)